MAPCPGALAAHLGAMAPCPGALAVHLGALEAHLRAFAAYLGVLATHLGALATHLCAKPGHPCLTHLLQYNQASSKVFLLTKAVIQNSPLMMSFFICIDI